MDTQNVLFPSGKSSPSNAQDSSRDVKVPTVRSFILYEGETARVAVTVSAEVMDGCLEVSGQDFGDAVQEFFNDDEHEYIYRFDQENTRKLFVLLDPDMTNIKSVLITRFGGMSGCSELSKFCDSNGIAYTYFSC